MKYKFTKNWFDDSAIKKITYKLRISQNTYKYIVYE